MKESEGLRREVAKIQLIGANSMIAIPIKSSHKIASPTSTRMKPRDLLFWPFAADVVEDLIVSVEVAT